VGVLRSEPWRRAPRLLLRHPAVLAAIAGTCALLAIAAASGPLFLSSAGAAALQRRVAEQCPEADRPAVRSAAGDGPAVTAAVTAAGLPAPYQVVVDGISAPFGVNTTPTELTLYGRADAFEHVRKVTGGGQGLWVSDLDAQRFRVKPGDRLAVGSLSVPIAGLYEDLAGPGLGRELPPYWCSWTTSIVPSLENRPPPFLLADSPTMDRIVAAYEAGDSGQFARGIESAWYAPVDTARLTLTEADTVLAGQDRLAAGAAGGGYEVRSGLAVDLVAARATRDGITGAITPVALAGVLVAVLLVGAAASFWVDQRRAELRLLGARGIGPAALAGKAVLELGLPALAGAAAGWAPRSCWSAGPVRPPSWSRARPGTRSRPCCRRWPAACSRWPPSSPAAPPSGPGTGGCRRSRGSWRCSRWPPGPTWACATVAGWSPTTGRWSG